MKLTPKQETFCLAYIETGNASEAYRGPISINREASALLDNPKITARLGELRDSAQVKAILTLEAHMSELQVLRDLAKKSGQYSAAIKAEELRGKLCKFYVDQREPASKDAGPVQPEDPRQNVKDHLAGLAERYALGLRMVQGYAPVKTPKSA